MLTLITFIIFTAICMILTYYFNLFVTQNVYTRSELSNVFPQVGNMLNKIYNKYSIPYLIIFFAVSSLTGILILSIFGNWFFNSAILPAVCYFFGPRLAVYFEQTRVTITEDTTDIIQALYSKYYNIIMIGFFCGYATKLIDNWINNEEIGFYWFILNFIIITSMTVITLRNDIFE